MGGPSCFGPMNGSGSHSFSMRYLEEGIMRDARVVTAPPSNGRPRLR
jgi:hypothetical protein